MAPQTAKCQAEPCADPGPILPPTYVVLINPGVAISTPSVFKAHLGAFSEPAEAIGEPSSAHDLASQLTGFRNDLTGPAIKIAPVIQEVLVALDTTTDCLISRMSGSGATCFGIFETKSKAMRAAKVISANNPGWWIKTASLLA